MEVFNLYDNQLTGTLPSAWKDMMVSLLEPLQLFAVVQCVHLTRLPTA